ncbi:orphan sodium- and chloride-dependent neurotransmitter transporter NTT5-like [Elephas maximus indicus]|uniref:orphan sodium- and chloride-dependent neurotransmitter transporter NTT5-like n=1 Tax=Elephas maximus indicus TaxID=99487 RepID=UPI0021165768|nr:orphan sodium- and chloride-dependent neurotransmitter transporter NTT5-like [Elephas maximus indicus]
MSLRSIQKSDLSLEETGASQDNLPGMSTEAKASETSLAKSSFTETNPSQCISEIQTCELSCPETWSTVTFVSETQVAKVRAWETQAWEAQSRSSQLKQDFLSKMESVSARRHRASSLKVQVTKKKKNEDSTRPLWSNKVEYILAQVGYSVGSMNIWSFPNLWIQNGGVFLVFYILMLFLIGVPLLFMEMASGQRLRQGSLGVWKLTSPWMTGLGYTTFLVCFIEGLVFNLVNCWSLLYLSQSFQFPVPWETCPLVKNSSEFDPECARTTPSMYFWYRKTLKASDTIEDGGVLIPSVTLSLLLIWFLTGLIMINGLKSTGKVSLYFCFP